MQSVAYSRHSIRKSRAEHGGSGKPCCKVFASLLRERIQLPFREGHGRLSLGLSPFVLYELLNVNILLKFR